MKECLIRNLCDGPRDYPLADGSSIYLGSKSRSTGIVRIPAHNISEALRLAESKGLVQIEKIRSGEADDEGSYDYDYDEGTKEYLVTNLCDGPCDYPLIDGTSIYLGSKGSSTESATVQAENISEALKLAASKGFVSIEGISYEEAAG